MAGHGLPSGNARSAGRQASRGGAGNRGTGRPRAAPGRGEGSGPGRRRAQRPRPRRPRPGGRRRVALAPAGHHRSSLHRLLFRLNPFLPPGLPRRSLSVAPSVRADLLPHHRDVAAAWLLTDLNQVLNGRGAAILPAGTDRGAPAGPALTLLLAYTLGAHHRTHRQAGLDALLSLSAAGNLNSRSLGEHLGGLIADHVLALHLVIPALTQTVQAGALADTWKITAALLSEILPGLATPPAGLPQLLTLAADLATTLRPRDHIIGLAQLSRRHEATQTVREARRLQAILTGRANIRTSP
jgi:hypothetical protein